MLKIGLTGGIGSGKSAAAKYFAELGIEIIDADIIAHELITPGKHALNAITEHFGMQILLTTGELNRKKMRELVFTNPTEKQWLENLLHPLIFSEIKLLSTKIKSHYCIFVIPLLFETNAKNIVDRILVIDCPEQTQIDRITQRDSTTVAAVKNIISSQVSRKQRVTAADDIIYNNGTEKNLKYLVTKLHQFYLSCSKLH